MVPRLPHLFMSASHGQCQGLLSVRAEVRLPDHNCTDFFMTVQLSTVKKISVNSFLGIPMKKKNVSQPCSSLRESHLNELTLSYA